MPDDIDKDDIDDKIEYHREMEHLAYQAKDLALAAHHRWMQDMLVDLKKKGKQGDRQGLGKLRSKKQGSGCG